MAARLLQIRVFLNDKNRYETKQVSTLGGVEFDSLYYDGTFVYSDFDDDDNAIKSLNIDTGEIRVEELLSNNINYYADKGAEGRIHIDKFFNTKSYGTVAILEVDGGDSFAVENIDQENHAQLIELKGDLGGKYGFEIQDVTEDKMVFFTSFLKIIQKSTIPMEISDGRVITGCFRTKKMEV